MPVLSVSVPPSTSSPPLLSTPKKASNVGPIVGGVIGGIIGLGLVIFLTVFLWRCAHAERRSNIEKAYIKPAEFAPTALLYDNRPECPTRGGNEVGRLSRVRYIPPSKESRTITPATTENATPITSATALSNSSASASSGQPTSTVSSSRGDANAANPISSDEVHGLRVEVENLRRVMQVFRQNALDPPPQYVGS